MNGWTEKTVRSPLLHFLLIGAAIYAGNAVLSPDAPKEPSNTLRITAGEISWLEDAWTKQWNRPPTAAERDGLIAQHLRETVLYREALAMGLDKDDVIIRRRLAQKLEFLFQDLADAVPPTPDVLETYFTEHAERYRKPDTVTMTHVFIDPDKRGDQTLDDAAEILAQLEADEQPTERVAELSDTFMLQYYYPQRSHTELAKLFGQGFAESVFELSTGQWHGPVLSGYGVHLVYVHDRSEAPPAVLEMVQDRVFEDWRTEQRETFNDQYYANLLARYDVVIEREEPEDDANDKVAAR